MHCPKLRLWAKMIDKGRHDDYDNPPQIPLITGSTVPAKKKSGNVADALASASATLPDFLHFRHRVHHKREVVIQLMCLQVPNSHP